MCHVAAHFFAVVTAAAPRREVQRLNKAPASERAEALQPPQILRRVLRLKHQCEKAAVRRDDHVRVLPALERERRAAVRLVTVAERGIKRIVRAFGHAPRLAREAAALLRVETEFATFVQQAVTVQWQKQLRHQVFEHRTRPARKPAVAVLLKLTAAQPPPVLHRHVALRNGDIACQHRLARHQVVPPARGVVVRAVVADIEQAAPRIIERSKVHGRGKRREPVRLRVHAPFAQCADAGDEPREQIPAVNGGDERRGQRQECARVVPVVPVPHEARHLFKRRGDAGNVPRRVPACNYIHVAGRDCRRHRKADVRRRCAVRRAYGRLLLKIIRRQKVVLCRGEILQIAP